MTAEISASMGILRLTNDLQRLSIEAGGRNAPKDSVTTCALLSLPAELRNRIYAYVLTKPEGLKFSPHLTQRKKDVSSPYQLQV